MKEQEGKTLRLESLDALRGFTIFLMLFVNNFGLDVDTPPYILHAPWNSGIYLADFVFPWFLYCVGVAIPFSYYSFKKKGLTVYQFYFKAFGRMILLFLFGCLINSSIAKTPVFSLGVLQLIALAYFAGSLFYKVPGQSRAIIAAVLLLGYWVAIKFIPIPGIGAGFFEENKNLLYYLNTTYLKSLNLAGLFSVIPTTGMVIIGSLIGDYLLKQENQTIKTRKILLLGIGLSLIGMLWNTSLPYNKNVWTPSYIVVMAGLATIFLGILYFIIDVKNNKKWAYPLMVFGSNAIFAYVVPILLKLWIFQEWRIAAADGKTVTIQQGYISFLMGHTGRIEGGWLYTFTYILFWWLVLWQLYRKKMFFKV